MTSRLERPSDLVSLIDKCRCSAPGSGADPLANVTLADSRSGRDKSVESFSWSLPLQGLAWALVEQGGDGVEVFLGVDRQVGALGQELTDEAVPVLVAPALPGRMGVAEVDRDAGGNLEDGVRGHLDPLIPGEELGQVVG